MRLPVLPTTATQLLNSVFGHALSRFIPPTEISSIIRRTVGRVSADLSGTDLAVGYENASGEFKIEKVRLKKKIGSGFHGSVYQIESDTLSSALGVDSPLVIKLPHVMKIGNSLVTMPHSIKGIMQDIEIYSLVIANWNKITAAANQSLTNITTDPSFPFVPILAHVQTIYGPAIIKPKVQLDDFSTAISGKTSAQIQLIKDGIHRIYEVAQAIQHLLAEAPGSFPRWIDVNIHNIGFQAGSPLLWEIGPYPSGEFSVPFDQYFDKYVLPFIEDNQ